MHACTLIEINLTLLNITINKYLIFINLNINKNLILKNINMSSNKPYTNSIFNNI